VPPTPGFETPPGPFFHKIHFQISLASTGALSVIKSGPNKPKVPTRNAKGAQKVTFSTQKRDFSVLYRRELSYARTIVFTMFYSHCTGPGSSLFALKIAWGTHCAPGPVFFALLCPLWASKWSPRTPQGSAKSPTGFPKPPQGRLKSIKKSI
jgi:hypothetical protein